MKTLQIDEKWSVLYDDENNDRPTEILRHGEVRPHHGPSGWTNDVQAMFYALLDERSEKRIPSAGKPTVPGFYYYRHPGADPWHIWIAQVSETRAAGLYATVLADLLEHRRSHKSIDDLKGDWFGPLPSPESFGA